MVFDLVRNGSEWLPELKVVWAAVSVAEDDFDELELESVEPFDVTVEVPVRLHMPYFTEVFGAEIAEGAGEGGAQGVARKRYGRFWREVGGSASITDQKFDDDKL